MYLSVRRSQHALLAIAFFVVMILTVFSTLLYVYCLTCGLILNGIRYFAERGTWDETLQAFINSDGDPTQFSVGLDHHQVNFLLNRDSLSQPRPGEWLPPGSYSPSHCMFLRFVLVSESFGIFCPNCDWK